MNITGYNASQDGNAQYPNATIEAQTPFLSIHQSNNDGVGSTPQHSTSPQVRSVESSDSNSRSGSLTCYGSTDADICSTNAANFSNSTVSNSSTSSIGTLLNKSGANNHNTSVYYGDSSALSMLSQVQATARHGVRGFQLPSIRCIDVSSLSPGKTSASFTSDFDIELSLPPRDLADKLLCAYWDGIHPLNPHIHKPSFQSAYENLWLREMEQITQELGDDIGLGAPFMSKTERTIFYCGLNCIFALGSLSLNLDQVDRAELCKSFYARFEKMLTFDLLGIPSLALVQVLLLAAHLHQCNFKGAMCWTFVGMACRVAQSIGLHNEYMSEDESSLTKEYRRRTWYACAIFDL